MALFIKPSSFFLKFFALTFVFQVSVSVQKLLAGSPEHTPTPSASVENKSENKDLPADFENLPVDWIERSISVMTTNNGTESERKYFIFCDVTPSIDPAWQTLMSRLVILENYFAVIPSIDAAGQPWQTSTASTCYIYARNSDQKIPEELQNLIQPVDPVENAESPNLQTDPKDLLQLINSNLITENPPIFHLLPVASPTFVKVQENPPLFYNLILLERNPPIFIPNIPPRILNGATYQYAVPGEGEKDLIIILESAQGYQHNATFTLDSKGIYRLVHLSGQLPSGTPYILTAPEPLSKADKADEADNEKLGQLRQQRDVSAQKLLAKPHFQADSQRKHWAVENILSSVPDSSSQHSDSQRKHWAVEYIPENLPVIREHLQRDEQEENNNHPESTDGSSDD